MREQGISNLSPQKTTAYKKQACQILLITLKEEDRCMRKQGISLVMSSFSSEIED